jgi:hypothetical protein
VTHVERVLHLLSDGKPHAHMEGYRLGVMLHSRVADLRRKGYDIACWREGDNYLYQLLAGPSAEGPHGRSQVFTASDTPRSVASSEPQPNDASSALSRASTPTAGQPSHVTPLAAGRSPQQLELEVA